MNLIQFIILFYPLFRFRRTIRNKLKALNDTLATLEAEKQRSLTCGAKSAAEIQNVGIYLCTLNYDLMALTLHLTPEMDVEVKKVFCRQLAILLYEFLDDIPQLLGHKLRAIVKELPNSEENHAALKEIGRKIAAIRRANDDQLKLIRNYVGAHRDLDGDKQLEVIRQIDPKAIQAIVMQVDTAIHQIVLLLAKLISSFSWSRLQLREIARHVDASALDKPNGLG